MSNTISLTRPDYPPAPHQAAMARPCSVIKKAAKRGPWLQLGQPHGFEWNCYELPVPGSPPGLQGLRIVHVSDFHLRRRWYPVLDRLLERLEQHPPDLLLMTGDFVQNRHNYRPALPQVMRLVAGFRARLGCFGILGNHDQHALAPHFEGTNLTFLENKFETVKAGDTPIELIGLPGHHRDEVRPEFIQSVPPKREGALRIVLSHQPDNIRRIRSLAADMVLAGHTHGGQVCLPGGFPIIRHDKLPRRMVKGIHRYHDTWLVITKGLGFSGPPIRLFCPAEVIELELTRP